MCLTIHLYPVLYARSCLIKRTSCIFVLCRSAFFIFCSDHRPKVKSENPGIGIGDIAKKLGDQWSKLSAKDKTPYEQKAVKLKEKYEKVCVCVFYLKKKSLYFSDLDVCGFQDMAAYRAKGAVKTDGAKKAGPGRPAGKKVEVTDDDDDDEDEEEEDEDEDDVDDDDDE